MVNSIKKLLMEFATEYCRQAGEQTGRKQRMFCGYYPLKLSDLLRKKIRRIIIALCNDRGQLHYPFKSFLPLCCVLIFTFCLNHMPFNFIWLVVCFTIQKTAVLRKRGLYLFYMSDVSPFSPIGECGLLWRSVLSVSHRLTDVSWNVLTEFPPRRWCGSGGFTVYTSTIQKSKFLQYPKNFTCHICVFTA
jgi:hypothetical protein